MVKDEQYVTWQRSRGSFYEPGAVYNVLIWSGLSISTICVLKGITKDDRLA